MIGRDEGGTASTIVVRTLSTIVMRTLSTLVVRTLSTIVVQTLSTIVVQTLPFQPTLQTGIEFLTYLFDNGYTYHQIAMARSALSSVIVMENHCRIMFGKHPLVKRVLKGIFEARPVFPKYNTVWDVNTLFNFF